MTTEDYSNLLKIKLNKFGIKDNFDLIIGNQQVGTMKPNIKYVKIAWDIFDLNHKKCWYVGDKYEKDCALGQRNGGKTVIVGIEDCWADFQIKDFGELKEIMEKYYWCTSLPIDSLFTTTATILGSKSSASSMVKFGGVGLLLGKSILRRNLMIKGFGTSGSQKSIFFVFGHMFNNSRRKMVN